MPEIVSDLTVPNQPTYHDSIGRADQERDSETQNDGGRDSGKRQGFDFDPGWSPETILKLKYLDQIDEDYCDLRQIYSKLNLFYVLRWTDS